MGVIRYFSWSSFYFISFRFKLVVARVGNIQFGGARVGSIQKMSERRDSELNRLGSGLSNISISEKPKKATAARSKRFSDSAGSDEASGNIQGIASTLAVKNGELV